MSPTCEPLDQSSTSSSRANCDRSSTLGPTCASLAATRTHRKAIGTGSRPFNWKIERQLRRLPDRSLLYTSSPYDRCSIGRRCFLNLWIHLSPTTTRRKLVPIELRIDQQHRHQQPKTHHTQMDVLEAAPNDAELDTSRSSPFFLEQSTHITRHPRLQSSDFIDPFAFEQSERMTNTKHSRPFPRITYPKENGRKRIPSLCWLLLTWEKSRILSETPSSYLVKRLIGWQPAQRNAIPYSACCCKKKLPNRSKCDTEKNYKF
jgi:hypothetical protein